MTITPPAPLPMAYSPHHPMVPSQVPTIGCPHGPLWKRRPRRARVAARRVARELHPRPDTAKNNSSHSFCCQQRIGGRVAGARPYGGRHGRAGQDAVMDGHVSVWIDKKPLRSKHDEPARPSWRRHGRTHGRSTARWPGRQRRGQRRPREKATGRGAAGGARAGDAGGGRAAASMTGRRSCALGRSGGRSVRG